MVDTMQEPQLSDGIYEANCRAKELEHLELIRKLETSLADKLGECELLKIKLAESSRDAQLLGLEFDKLKLSAFESTEDSKKIHEEVLKSKKLEEDYVKLMSAFLELSERCEQYRLNIYDKYLAKSNAINNFDCRRSSGCREHELADTSQQLQDKMAELCLATAKIRHLEEEVSSKEKYISDLRKVLDDAKVTHKHEITVLDEYIQSLKNTIASYEKALSDYMEPKSKTTTTITSAQIEEENTKSEPIAQEKT